MKHQKIAYFGYGSLVNLSSLRTPYISAHRVRLSGWRRTWLKRPVVPGSFAPIENLAFLSAEPSKQSVIEGLIITDQKSSLPSLDKREVFYDRVAIKQQDIEYLDEEPSENLADCFIYVAQQPPAGQSARILRSYLDVVFQGYKQQFGCDGPSNFIASTSNFDLPILEDRKAPIYPRAVTLDAEDHHHFSSLLPLGSS